MQLFSFVNGIFVQKIKIVKPNMHNPPHPGEVVRSYLGDTSITAAAVAMHVSRGTLQRIVSGTAGISADMAYRLAAITGTSAEMWAKMQMQYDLWQAKFVKRPTLKRMLARFDPVAHGGEIVSGAPVGREAFAKRPERRKRPAKA